MKVSVIVALPFRRQKLLISRTLIKIRSFENGTGWYAGSYLKGLSLHTTEPVIVERGGKRAGMSRPRTSPRTGSKTDLIRIRSRPIQTDGEETAEARGLSIKTILKKAVQQPL